MSDLFNRLETTKKRVIAQRQVQLLKILLEVDEINLLDLHKKTASDYKNL